MGLFDFALIRRSVLGLEQQLQKMQEEEAELRMQLAQVSSAPASKDDMKQMLSGWVASNAEKYRLSLRETLSKFMRNPRNFTPRNLVDVMSISGAAQPGSDAVRTQDVDQALCALFGPLLNRALLDEIDGMEWPDNTISSVQRSAETIRLTTKIDELNSQIEELAQSAIDAGITWNRNGGTWK
jgi:hypothetical protein